MPPDSRSRDTIKNLSFSFTSCTAAVSSLSRALSSSLCRQRVEKKKSDFYLLYPVTGGGCCMHAMQFKWSFISCWALARAHDSLIYLQKSAHMGGKSLCCSSAIWDGWTPARARELSVIQLFRSIALINLVLLSDVKCSAVHLHGAQ